MADYDQKLRHLAVKNNDWKSVKKFDHLHSESLKKIISRYGWPTINMVGKKTSKNAWLIVQHADHDRSFQKHCLVIMKRELSKNPLSISKVNIAYLTDRILISSGKKQLFGTQFKRDSAGIMTLRPITNKKEVNKRRKEYGMETLEEYVQIALNRK